MANIELVIKIDEEYVKQIDRLRFSSDRIEDRSLQINVINAIKNGTPLPKGHDKLIDVKDLREQICLEDTKENRKLNLGEIITLEDIDRIEPIIEADRE